MKKIIFLLSLLALANIRAQESYGTWEENIINGSISNISFLNDNLGFCISSATKSQILKTTNGGNN